MHISLFNLTNSSAATLNEGAAAQDPTTEHAVTFEALFLLGAGAKPHEREGSFPHTPQTDLGEDESKRTAIAVPKDHIPEGAQPREKDPIGAKLAAPSAGSDAQPSASQVQANQWLVGRVPKLAQTLDDTRPKLLPQTVRSARVDEGKETLRRHPDEGASRDEFEAPLEVIVNLPKDTGGQKPSRPHQADGGSFVAPGLYSRSVDRVSVSDRALSRDALPIEPHNSPEAAQNARTTELRNWDELRSKGATEPFVRPPSQEVSQPAEAMYAEPVVNGGALSLSHQEAESVSSPIAQLQEGTGPASRIIEGKSQRATPAHSVDRLAVPSAAAKTDRLERTIGASEPAAKVTLPPPAQTNRARTPSDPEEVAAAADANAARKRRGESSFVAAFRLNAQNGSDGASPPSARAATLQQPIPPDVLQGHGAPPMAAQNIPRPPDAFLTENLPVEVRQSVPDQTKIAPISTDVPPFSVDDAALRPPADHPDQAKTLDRLALADPPNSEGPKASVSIVAPQAPSVENARSPAMKAPIVTREKGPEATMARSDGTSGAGVRIVSGITPGLQPIAPTGGVGPAFPSEPLSTLAWPKQISAPPESAAKGLHLHEGDHQIAEATPVPRFKQTSPEALGPIVVPDKAALAAPEIRDLPSPDSARPEVEGTDAPAPSRNGLRAVMDPRGIMPVPVPPMMTTHLPDGSLQPVKIDIADDGGAFGLTTLVLGGQHVPTTHNAHPQVGLHPAVLAQISQGLQVLAQQGPNDQMNLTLNPEELGRLRFEMTSTGERVHVSLFVERGETMDLLRRNVDQLLSDLRQSGFGQASLSFGSWSQRGQTKGERGASSMGPDLSETNGVSAAPISTRQIAADGRLDMRL
jgi:hypothetical protein